MFARITILFLFGVLLVAPFLFRPDHPPPPPGARQLIIVSPHNEQIRHEFAQAFDTWHRAQYGEPVAVIFSSPGGTSEIRKMLFAQYKAAIEQGREPGGSADLVFGGGSYEHDALRRGVQVVVDGERRDEPVTAPVAFEPEWLDQTYGTNDIGGIKLYDPEGYWFGTALSGFGIVFNRDELAAQNVEPPTTWSDLGDPRLVGRVALVNPGQSGSIKTTFEAILHREGWDRGWKILRRAAANARYFSGSSLKPPTDVSSGDATLGISIDFYGRYQAQAIRMATGRDRLGYVVPKGVSTIDPDPVSMLRGAPDPELARRFIEFTLTDIAQSLWQFRVDDPVDDELGPERFELRRLPIIRDFYQAYPERLIDQVNPFETATALENPERAVRSFIAVVFAAMAMENHHQLRAAWERIIAHPAYPAGRELVDAKMVTDPELRAWLTAFDAMPTVPGPDDVRYELTSTTHLSRIKSGWFGKEWADSGIWPKEASPADAMRRQCAAFFRGQYESIVRQTE